MRLPALPALPVCPSVDRCHPVDRTAAPQARAATASCRRCPRHPRRHRGRQLAAIASGPVATFVAAPMHAAPFLWQVTGARSRIPCCSGPCEGRARRDLQIRRGGGKGGPQKAARKYYTVSSTWPRAAPAARRGASVRGCLCRGVCTRAYTPARAHRDCESHGFRAGGRGTGKQPELPNAVTGGAQIRGQCEERSARSAARSTVCACLSSQCAHASVRTMVRDGYLCAVLHAVSQRRHYVCTPLRRPR